MRAGRASKPTFSRRHLHGQVAYALGVRIVSGEIGEGATLAAEDVAAAQLDVSRTAYREAIKVLTSKGLLESRPKVGTRVRPRSDWNMLDPDVLLWASENATTMEFADALFEFRQIIEPAAARMAAERGTPKRVQAIQLAMQDMLQTDPSTRQNVDADLAFHSAILQASGNELLSSLSYVVEALLERSFVISSHVPEARQESQRLHQAITDHIAHGEAQEAEQAMSRLLKEARDDIDRVLKLGNAVTTTAPAKQESRNRR